MRVNMVHVGQVRMLVAQARVPMPMGVRLAGGIIGPMHVLMVGIVDVAVGMLHRLMLMLVDMNFSKMKPDANGHQDTCRSQLHR